MQGDHTKDAEMMCDASISLLSHNELELLEALINADVEFVIVGGAAVNAHGYRRAREDIDILLRQTRTNLARLIDVQLNWIRFNDTRIAALEEAGAKIQDVRRRLDILTDFHGMDLNQIFETRVIIEVDGLRLPFMSKPLIIASKESAISSGEHTKNDLADLQALF
ncbi:hypothetical protein GOL31_29425 [Sinorhizobium medicae]|uniref:hypothetical protein n=2 Tax=Rhizobium meliloti TaxID=382 RepID=UPI0013E2A911|nr:hypothetical protein [Sinorhizobium meliloti]MDX1115862.1 hypothetical protein [Sinorhizobium medicae]